MSTGRSKLRPWRRRTVETLMDIEEIDDGVGRVGENEAQHEADGYEAVGDDIGFDVADDTEDHGYGVEEETCSDLAIHFGDVVRDGVNDSDCDSGDDIWDDENVPDPLLSDEDDEEVERREALANTVDADEILALGKTFGCAVDFKTALLRYSLKTRFDIKMFKSTTYKLGAKCSDEEIKCPWRVYCSYEKRKHKLQIKVYVNEHICMKSGYSKLLKGSSIAMLFSERLRINPKLTRKEMVDEIKREYYLNVTDNQCGKAKGKLYRERKASHEIHFSRIWDYQAEILKSNPYSTMVIETIPGPTPGSKQRFDRLYVCFESQRESWIENCRPIIGLDGAFLKWDIKGHLLAAVGRDGDNRIVPIAWAVVEVENNINWEWFVKLLKDDLRLEDGAKITIISDKQKGIINAIQNELPKAEHRMCCRHVLTNWKRDTKDPELERLFWKIARSYTEGEYADNLQALRSYNTGAYDTLQLTAPTTWSRCFFSTRSLCNDNLNNLSESFNRTIRESRRKPILDLLEDIRRQCMVRNAKRATIANRLKTRFTKRAHLEIESAKEKSKDCIIYTACTDLHEVDHHGVAYRVDMVMKTCGCIKWQLTGIPCIHDACVIIADRLKIENFVSDLYTTKKWQQTYARGIKHVQGMMLWPRLNRLVVLPPPFRLNPRGRPRNHDRRKSANESSSSSNKTRLSRDKRVITCSKCKEEGHNKTRCPNATVEPIPKRPRGRPRKDQEGERASQEASQGASQIPFQGGSQRASQARP